MLKFLNRKTLAILLMGIIFILLVALIVGIFLYFIFQEPKRENKIPVEWKKYENNALGISFYYPPEWGNPHTEPNEVITDLSKINEKYIDTGSYFANSVSINFSEQKTPEVRMYNDEYKGQLYPNAYALRFGPIDNFSEMKESADICDYKIKFDHRPGYKGTIDEVYNKCENKVKTYITRNLTVYDGVPAVLYNYELEDSSFVKLQNGYFDNAFINYFYSMVQSPSDKLGLDDLLKKVEGSWQEDKEKFSIFVNSIEAFKPVVSSEQLFENVKGGDRNVTVIRKYYFEITRGNLQNAYDMYQYKPVNFETYREWYKDTLMANPVEFERVGDNRYQFKVHFQGENQEEELYRVVMEVNGEKINPISSERIITSPVSLGSTTAFVKQQYSKSYLVLSKNGREKILDEGSDSPINMAGGPVISGPLEFSPGGNYLMCDIYGWEWYGTNIYDVEREEKVLELSLSFIAGFTSNEKYFFACANSDFGGEYYGKVYSTQDFKEIYDASTGNYTSIDCEYDKNEQVIRFKLDDVYNPADGQIIKQPKTVEFSAVTGEAETINE